MNRSSLVRLAGGRRAAHVVLVLGALGAFGGAGCTCKKTKTEEAKKDDKPSKKAPLTEVAAPADLLAEIDLRDPDAFVKRAADGAGFGKEVGSSPYEKLVAEAKDENAKKALKAIDPHGALVIVALGDVAKALKEEKADDNFHAIGAARLKDAELASTALGAAAKAGKFKTKESKSLDTTLYLPEGASKKGVIAIIGDEILAADTPEVMEAAGRYVAARAARAEKQEHDLEGHIVTERLAKPSVKFLDGVWGKYKTEIPGKAGVEADKLVQGFLAGFGDTGDVDLTADVKGDDVLFVQKIAAKGSFSKWLSKYPTVDPKALLSMPKGAGVAAFTVPDGFGPVVYEGIDEGMKSGKVPPADAADVSKNVRALGGALGHEVSYTSATHGAAGPGMASPATEIFARVELTDAGAAKTALLGLTAAGKKSGGLKAKGAPYKKAGGEGETWTIEEGAKASTFVWAIKASYLYLDVCVNCTPTVFDGALDGKDLLDGDGTAKSKITSYPTKGLVSASYGDADTYGKLLSTILGSASGPTPTGSTWGYVTASADGVEGRSGIPLSVLGGIVRAVMMVGAHRSPLGGALAPPPPGMDE